jgi:3-keto-5-aminohexanoate cleavage enzyme
MKGIGPDQVTGLEPQITVDEKTNEMNDLIICVAPYPGEKQVEKFPGPLNTTEEIVRSYDAGAAIAHLHVRDERGLQTVNDMLFRAELEKIKMACPVIIEVSTGGAPQHSLAERCVGFLAPQAELGTLNLGSVNMYDGLFGNPPEEIIFYAKELKRRHLKPTLTVFDLSHLHRVEALAGAGLIEPPYVFNLVFDVPNALPYKEQYLELYLKEMPKGSVWFVTRYHAHGIRDLSMVFALGGHSRIGYEDGPFLSDGTRARSNADLVQEVSKAAETAGRTVVSPERARTILGINR